MAKAYGTAAVLAAEMSSGTPQERWQFAVRTCFPDSESSRKKSCPKQAFLGLCDEGLIRNIPPGNYSRSSDNKSYAVRGVQLLRSGRYETPADLWNAIMNGKEKRYNGQAHVVMALWNSGFII